MDPREALRDPRRTSLYAFQWVLGLLVFGLHVMRGRKCLMSWLVLSSTITVVTRDVLDFLPVLQLHLPLYFSSDPGVSDLYLAQLEGLQTGLWDRN